jgi:hypothetical protein
MHQPYSLDRAEAQRYGALMGWALCPVAFSLETLARRGHAAGELNDAFGLLDFPYFYSRGGTAAGIAVHVPRGKLADCFALAQLYGLALLTGDRSWHEGTTLITYCRKGTIMSVGGRQCKRVRRSMWVT